MNKKERVEIKISRIKQTEAVLRQFGPMQSKEVAGILGVSRPLANIYLNELEAAGVAKVRGTVRNHNVGREGFVWQIVRKPWHRRVIDWFTRASA